MKQTNKQTYKGSEGRDDDGGSERRVATTNVSIRVRNQASSIDIAQTSASASLLVSFRNNITIVLTPTDRGETSHICRRLSFLPVAVCCN